MSFITKRLEEILFDEKTPLEEIHEVVKYLSLEEEEIEKIYKEDQSFQNKYFGKDSEKIFLIEEPKTEEETSSDEEILPTFNAKMGKGEKGESSTSYHSKKYEFSMPYHKGIPNSEKGSSNTINTINIDCIFDFQKRREVIDKWNTEISLIIQSNPDEFVSSKAVLLLIEHKSAGIIQEFIKKTSWNEDLHGIDTFDTIIKALYVMFLGLDYINNQETENQKEIEKARQILTKAQLCDICYLDDFTCVFEKNIYKLDTGEYHSWIEAYLMKIPIVGDKAKERWNKEKTGLTMHSLGFATRIVKEEIAAYCDFSNKQKQLKKFNKRCCERLIESEQILFGCSPNQTKTRFKDEYKKKYKKRFYKKEWRKKKKRFTPGKYFSKEKSKEKQKVCPQGKKKCRCWICSEEGHYANECPNRQKFHDKVKLIQEAAIEGFYPIEDFYEEEQKVFLVKLIKESSSSETDSSN